MTRLAWAAVAFALGVWAGELWRPPQAALTLFLGSAISLGLLLRSLPGRRLAAGIALLTACFLAGALRIGADPLDRTLPDLAARNATVTVSGVVADDPEPAGRFLRLRLRTESVRDGEREPVRADGVILATLPLGPDLTYGDHVTLRGRVTPAGEPAFADRLRREGVAAAMPFPRVVAVDPGLGSPAWAAAYAVRRRLSAGLDRALPEPQAGLAKALLLDLRRAVDPAVTDSFRASGTAHILAISGQHVALVLGVTIAAAAWVFGKRRNVYLLVPLTAVWAYTFVAGLPPSATRSAVMGTVYVGALALGRPSAALPALAAATLGMLLVDPRTLFSASLQLSVGAVAGMIAFSEPIAAWIHRWLTFRRPQEAVAPWLWSTMRGLALALGVSLAATAATAPLNGLLFGEVPLSGLPATLLALPVTAFALGLGALAAGLGAAAPSAGIVVGWLAWLALSSLIAVAELFDRAPSVAFTGGRWATVIIVAWYGGLLAVLLRARPGRLAAPVRQAFRSAGAGPLPQSRVMRTAAFLGLAAPAALLWIAAAGQPDGRLRVHILDVGQGSATLIVTPSGRQVLVDGGPDPRVTLAALGRVVPFYDRTLDAVALSHPQDDHVGGLAQVARRYRVGVYLDSPQDVTLASYRRWREEIDASGRQRHTVARGASIHLGDGVVLEALWPPDPPLSGTGADLDNNGVVWRVRYGRFSALLPGDIQAVAERALVAGGADLDADVLLLPHHGSRTSSSEPFLRAVSPAAVAVSAGSNNRFGHPHPEALERVAAAAPGAVSRTDHHGTVTYLSDGARLWVRTARW